MEAFVKEFTNILVGLGVNETLYHQLAIFLVGYGFLYLLVFKPYFHMLKERENRTVGNEDLAGQILKKTKGLETEYQLKARQLNARYKEIYDQCRTEAMVEYEKIVNEAKHSAQDKVKKIRESMATNVSMAKDQMTGEKNQIAQVIASQVLGKRLS